MDGRQQPRSAPVAAPPPPPAPSQAVAPQARPAGPHAPAPTQRWLEDVRAQRRALREQRRARMEVRRHLVDPLDTARHDSRSEAFLRRRQERREMIETERRLFLNHGPWLEPMAPPPRPERWTGAAPGVADGHTDTVGPQKPPQGYLPQGHPPQDWNNGWYYRGW